MRSRFAATTISLILIVACTSDPAAELSAPVSEPAVETPSTGDVAEGQAEEPATTEVDDDTPATTIADSSPEPSTALPVRDGPRRETTGSVPHVQLNATPVPEVDAELRRRVFLLPGVEERDSSISTGARGIVITDGGSIARREILLSPGEFGHIHPDGSLHLWLPAERAAEVDDAQWGELHPWVVRDGFWDGVAMVFTPETPEELEVTMQLVVDAYNFVMDTNLTVADVA